VHPGASSCAAGEVCDVSNDSCQTTCSGCVIGGVCYAPGTRNPDNQCQSCVTSSSTDAWTTNTGASCDDGLYWHDGGCLHGRRRLHRRRAQLLGWCELQWPGVLQRDRRPLCRRQLDLRLGSALRREPGCLSNDMLRLRDRRCLPRAGQRQPEQRLSELRDRGLGGRLDGQDRTELRRRQLLYRRRDLQCGGRLHGRRSAQLR
jgi:hypothetical protein